MEALGFIETVGLLSSIEALDTMLKSSEVHLVSKEIVGGGLVTVTVSGDVAAVKTAVDAAAAAVMVISEESLISVHTIARPEESISELIEPDDLVKAKEAEELVDALEETLDELEVEEIVDSIEDNLTMDEKIKLWLETNKIEELKAYLLEFKTSELRNYANELEGFALSKKEIHKASKDKLLREYVNYYSRIS